MENMMGICTEEGVESDTIATGRYYLNIAFLEAIHEGGFPVRERPYTQGEITVEKRIGTRGGEEGLTEMVLRKIRLFQ